MSTERVLGGLVSNPFFQFREDKHVSVLKMKIALLSCAAKSKYILKKLIDFIHTSTVSAAE